MFSPHIDHRFAIFVLYIYRVLFSFFFFLFMKCMYIVNLSHTEPQTKMIKR